MHVNRPSLDILGIQPPDLTQELITRNRATTLGHQVTKKLGFSLGKFLPISILKADLPPCEVDLSTVYLVSFHYRRTFGAPPQHGIDPGGTRPPPQV